MADEMSPSVEASGRRFMRWGRSNAQFVAVGFVFVGAIYYVGAKVRKLQSDRDLFKLLSSRANFDADIKAARANFDADIKAARAEAIQQCGGQIPSLRLRC